MSKNIVRRLFTVNCEPFTTIHEYNLRQGSYKAFFHTGKFYSFPGVFVIHKIAVSLRCLNISSFFFITRHW